MLVQAGNLKTCAGPCAIVAGQPSEWSSSALTQDCMQKLISRCSKVSSSWQSSAVKQVSSAIPELTADAPQEREQFLLVAAANIESQRYLRARLAGSAWRTVSDAAMGLRCHYKILQEGGELLSPCVCRGSAKCARSFRRPVHQILQRRYVHVDCIEAAFRARGLLPQPSLRALCGLP